MNKRLNELHKLGQSIWYDNIQRSLLASGEFDELIAAGVLGMTSNPTIFEKAISGSTDYDEALKTLIAAGLELDTIYEELILEDIAAAADLLYKVYERTNGADGYVSVEVRPTLATETDETINEAKRLFKKLNRPNIMIKVPATPQGIPAIKALSAEGININVTLIFSIERYEDVAKAYLAGLEQRLAASEDISHVASVASFFVSRVDTKVDQQLDKLGNNSLKGKIGIANSKSAYLRFRKIFDGERWDKLKQAGAHLQRPLWASTSTKNPAYPDTLYMDNLIGPDTVNTAPPHTLEAFIDHGRVSLTLEKDTDQALAQLEQLDALGIDLDQVTRELQDEGVEAFANSFHLLMNSLSVKRIQLQSEASFLSADLGGSQGDVNHALREIAERKVTERIWEHDFTVWKPEPAEITNRLGWLHIARKMKDEIPQLEEFVSEIRQAGFTQALLLGMGGSSLAPQVFSKTFGVGEGALELAVLDSTDPGAIATQVANLDLPRTLFIVSTKSGGTVETLSLFKYFYNLVAATVDGENPGQRFIAITDAGSNLDKLAAQHQFRKTFHNDPNIGGRYSALSHFGLVPAALIGVDLEKLLERAADMEHYRAAYLGAILGELAKHGRDKLTLFCSPEISSFGDWVEQLIAESTGKEGKGILPVIGEAVNLASFYGNDRIFVTLQLSPDATLDELLEDLAGIGHPVVKMQLHGLYDLGEQFFLWELATAVAGSRLQINPFDQPNVEAAKVLAREMVRTYLERGKLPELKSGMELEGITIYPDQSLEIKATRSARDVIDQFLAEAKPSGYVALQVYIQPSPEADLVLQELRKQLRDQTRAATSLGYGPRFLHSTGQLHKGDAGLGMFIQLMGESGRDIPIPDQPGSNESGITFGVLKKAQALGDRQALIDAGRRVLLLDLGQEPIKGIKRLIQAGN